MIIMIYGTVVKQMLDKLRSQRIHAVRKLNKPIIMGVFALALPLSSCGGGGGSATPTVDTLANAYDITDVLNLVTGAVFTTNTITVSGINAPVTITTNLGSLVINGVNTGATSSTINNGDTVAITGTASPLNATALNGQVSIGNLTDIFSVTTKALVDKTPNPFNFTNITNAVPSATFTSNTITVAGVNTQVTATTTLGILVVNGINTGVSSTVVNNGDTIAITGTVSASNAATLNGTVTIGTLSDPFAVTRAAVINTAPTATNVTLDVLSQASITYNLNPNIADAQTPDSGLQVNVVAAPANGAVTLDTVNLHSFTYTGNAGLNGNDSFTYTAVDPGTLQSAVRMVTLNNIVNNSPPVITNIASTGSIAAGQNITGIGLNIAYNNLSQVTWSISYTILGGVTTGSFLDANGNTGATLTGTGNTLNGITFIPINGGNGWTIKATIVDSGSGSTQVFTIYAN